MKYSIIIMFSLCRNSKHLFAHSLITTGETLRCICTVTGVWLNKQPYSSYSACTLGKVLSGRDVRKWSYQCIFWHMFALVHAILAIYTCLLWYMTGYSALVHDWL